VTLNEKQSYLFTKTLIGVKLFIVASFSISFTTLHSKLKNLIDLKGGQPTGEVTFETDSVALEANGHLHNIVQVILQY
jgi:hypothetical protein